MPASYMEDWVDGRLSDLFTVNPQTFDRKQARFLDYFSKNADFSDVFKEMNVLVKNKGASTAFFPETFVVDKKKRQVQVNGRFLIHDAKLKKTIEEIKTFVLGWKTPDGQTKINSLKGRKRRHPQ